MTGWWFLLAVGSCHPGLQGQSLLAASSETWEMRCKTVNIDVIDVDVIDVASCTSFDWFLHANNFVVIFKFWHFRGFVHFATKEGALRLLEESAAPSPFECWERSAVFDKIIKTRSCVFCWWIALGSITYHRRALDIKAGCGQKRKRLTLAVSCHDLLECFLPVGVFLVSKVFLFLLFCQKASESKKVMSDDERSHILDVCHFRLSPSQLLIAWHGSQPSQLVKSGCKVGGLGGLILDSNRHQPTPCKARLGEASHSEARDARDAALEAARSTGISTRSQPLHQAPWHQRHHYIAYRNIYVTPCDAFAQAILLQVLTIRPLAQDSRDKSDLAS